MVPEHEPDPAALESTLIERIRRFETTRRRKRQLALGGALSIVLAAALVVAPSLLPGEDAAFALTPAPLEMTAPAMHTSEAINLLQHTLRESAGSTEATRESTSIGWYARIDGDSMALEDEPVVPQLLDTQWEEDLSGRMTFWTAHSEGPEDSLPSFVHDPGSSTWDVLYEFEFAPGEFDTPLASIDGDTADEMRAVLSAFGLDDGDDAARMLDVIALAFSHWTLTDVQHEMLLEILEDSGQIDVAGTTHDRAGRPVTAFRAASRDGDFEQLLLVSSETGRIVGLESIRTTAIGGVPAGTVLSYTLWEITP